MFRVVVIFAQVTNDVVGAQIDEETNEENAGADDELWRVKPCNVVVTDAKYLIIGFIGFKE